MSINSAYQTQLKPYSTNSNDTIMYDAFGYTNPYQDQSVFTQDLSTTTDYNYEQPVTGDGYDDGKISFGEAVKNFGKGLISPITSMFSSPKNFITGALGIAACGLLCAATGGAAAPLLVAGGAIAGGAKILDGAVKAVDAKTDEEAKQAWQGMGTGTSALAMSVAGAKTAAKAGGIEGAESMNALEATAACIQNAPKSIGNSIGAFTSGAWKTNLFGKKVVNNDKQPEKPADKTPEKPAQEPQTETNALTEQDTQIAAKDTKPTTNETGLSTVEEKGVSTDVKDPKTYSSEGNPADASAQPELVQQSAEDVAAEYIAKMKNAKTPKELRAIRRETALKFHPDLAEKNGYKVEFASEVMKIINAMYSSLTR